MCDTSYGRRIPDLIDQKQSTFFGQKRFSKVQPASGIETDDSQRKHTILKVPLEHTKEIKQFF